MLFAPYAFLDEIVDINIISIMSMDDTVTFQDTIRVRDCCLCLHVQRAARSLARLFDDALRPYGLTNGQFSLLMSLNRPHPPQMRAVADLLAMDRTTLTAALKPLEREGLLQIAVDPSDRRGRLLILTDAGRTKLGAAMPTWDKTHAEIEALLPDGDADRLRRDLLALS